MSGFKNETKLWEYIHPHLAVSKSWKRIETVFPDGFPDAFGKYDGRLMFIELKVGKPSVKALRSSQRDHIKLYDTKTNPIFVCFGGEKEKTVGFYRVVERVLVPVRPAFVKDSLSLTDNRD